MRGTHVNGLPGPARRDARILRIPQYSAARRQLSAAEDIWDRCAYVLSVKMQDPQFAGRTKSVCRRVNVRHLFPAW